MDAEGTVRTAAGEWVGLLKRSVESTEEAAFALLVQRQSRFVFKVAYAVLRQVEDAEDVTQEVFLQAFRNGAWRQIEDERSYLARVAWRVAVSRRPKQQWENVDEAAALLSRERSPEEAALRIEHTHTIHRLIDALPRKLRLPLALACTEELDTAEIAAVMNLPPGTVRRRLVEARTLLKTKLARLEGVSGNG